VLAASAVHGAGDPRLDWRTKVTPHFRVHYYSGEEHVAERIADLAEDVHRELSPVLASDPGHLVDVVLTDDSDSANGSATAYPYDLIRLFLVPPDELSVLGDVDDWYRTLFTHEYTHILHMTKTGGLPALWNRIVGRTLVPNQWVPRWTLEGLAVLEETEHTSRGRLRSSLWDAQFRADRMGPHPATLDRVTGNPRTFPQGTLWYLYGSFFFRWLDRHYGHAAIRMLIETQGSELIAYGLERAFRRATGQTLSELWERFLTEEDARVRGELARYTGDGLRDGEAVTAHGLTALHPRWLPAAGQEPERIVYFRSDGHDTAGVVAIPMAGGARAGESVLVTRTLGDATIAAHPGGDLVIASGENSNQVYVFGDLARVSARSRDRWGDGEERTRLTRGARADGLDVSPDGTRVVYVTRHRGRSALVEATLAGDALIDEQVLATSDDFDAFYAPRYAPDGSSIVYAAWLTPSSREARLGTRDGAGRDLYRFDRATRTSTPLTRDRALDGGPCFSPDGRWLFFHSDAGEAHFEIHALELASHKRFRVTRTPFAAVEPAVAPRGDFLAFASYGSEGWDLRTMPLDPARFEPFEAADDSPAAAHAEPPRVVTVDEPYVPLSSLRPRAYAVSAGTSTFGTAIVATTSGADATGNHRFTLQGRVETELPQLQFDAAYSYERLRADLEVRAYRTLSARGGGTNRALYVLPWVQESIGLETAATLPFPSTFTGQSASLAAGFTRIAGEPAPGALDFDPFNRPIFPFEGTVASLRAGWSYRRTQQFLYAIGAERGTTLGLSGLVASELVGSSRGGASVTASATHYLPLADLHGSLAHHTIALRGAAGTSDGDYPGPGAFSLGGFQSGLPFGTFPNVLVQGGVALRGYAPFALSGRSYGLANAEYRFPLLNVDRGVGAYPVFLKRLTGTLFTDVGTAFTRAGEASLRGGSGAELWVDTTGGYFVDLLFRVGVARGWSTDGLWQTYFLATTVY
jgi:sugar lactone lactonase YvrE